MKKLLFLASALIMSGASMAQERDRYMPENLTEYTNHAASSVRRVGTREGAPLVCTGSPVVPVVLVQFADTKFTSADTPEELATLYDDFCNKPNNRVSGGSWGSIYDYFNEQSDGLFTPKFKVIGPVTLQKGFAYYGKDSSSSRDININAFFSEACESALADYGFNWKDYDNDNDGKVDFVYFIYAGEGQNTKDADPNLIWPKESSSTYTIKYNGQSVSFGGYGCCCELFNGKMDGIGTMCHELSHALGLPDLYDRKGNEFGLDYFDIMDSGSYQLWGKQPCCYSAYERDFMGWRKLETVAKDAKVTLTLKPIEADGVGYKIINDGQSSGNEFFILENRQNIGFDTYYGCPSSTAVNNYGACHGLLIYHVDYLLSKWTTNIVNSDANHPRLTIVPADGVLNSSSVSQDETYYKSFRGDIYPGNTGKTEMSDYSVFVGEFTQTITNIQEHEDGTITVDINGGDPTAIGGIKTAAASVEIYSVSGVKLPAMQSGINIVRKTYPDGKIEVTKVLR